MNGIIAGLNHFKYQNQSLLVKAKLAQGKIKMRNQ